MALTVSSKHMLRCRKRTDFKVKPIVDLDHVHKEWTLQPHLESMPWDSCDELAFPIQVPSSYWAHVGDQLQPHKKQKLDCSLGETLHSSNENFTKKQLLVENIPPDATMSDMKYHVSLFGQIYSLVVLQTKSTNITKQLNSFTATVFFEKHSNLSALGSFDWKVFGKRVAAYLIRRSSLTWLRLTNLPHRTNMKKLKKCLSDYVSISEAVKHSQVCRTAILTFEEIFAVQDLLEAQHKLKKLLGNRLIFTANHDHVKKISVSPVQVYSLFLPEDYTALKWHRDTGTFYHDATTLTHNKMKIGWSKNTSFVNGKNISNGDCLGDYEYLDGRVTQWEYGKALAPDTICIVGLPADVKRKRLKKLFVSAECGTVVDVTLHLDRSPAHAYVTFEDKEKVDRALKAQCQLSTDAPRLLHFAASKTQSPAYLTELLLQAGHEKTNNNISTKDSTAHDVNMFKFSLFRHITTGDASSPVATTNQDPFELPPNQDPFELPPNQDPFELPPNQDTFELPPNQDPFELPPNQDAFELPPNTVLVVGGLGDCKTVRLKKAFVRFGKVLYLKLLKSAWPLHGYVTYASPGSARKAVEKQQQVNAFRMTLTVATKRKFTLKQIVNLTKEHPKLQLEGTTSTTPLFYRHEYDAPAWAVHYCT